ncbi:hypothetical protein CA600_27685 [Paenibacillus sp. VTT E-133280]|uniref:DUF6773 family protein n=1 Tax=Paenibacillus sp. VTT E-133280 TaxID=1986222 RepID=UPI000BA172D5|nr:DUF6773 family protein [Paenibacillus sp. VTT E-133280]OZQ60622.1 hypothetical protein CA600_27685 [Paenibacillus sp. VTT E-133280]
MKKSKINDERIVSQRRMTQSDAYQILVYCLMISVLIQQFIMNAPFAQFAVEFFCLIGSGIYITIRNLSVGVYIWDPPNQTNKKLLTNSIISGGICVSLLIILAGERKVWNMTLIFVAVTIIHFLTHLVLRNINKKRQRKIDDEISSDEDMEC